jgi:hypothetical protein
MMFAWSKSKTTMRVDSMQMKPSTVDGRSVKTDGKKTTKGEESLMHQGAGFLECLMDYTSRDIEILSKGKTG